MPCVWGCAVLYFPVVVGVQPRLPEDSWAAAPIPAEQGPLTPLGAALGHGVWGRQCKVMGADFSIGQMKLKYWPWQPLRSSFSELLPG